MVTVNFWGVRGSVPTPLTAEDVRGKVWNALLCYLKHRDENKNSACTPEKFLEGLSIPAFGTYGGNTSCVEVLCGDSRFVLDMGTGLRELGKNLTTQMFDRGGLDITFLLSHVHWDHIQGLPFFGPLFVNKETGIKNTWRFYGGTNWQETAQTCLRGQMDPPKFPVSWQEIEKLNYPIKTDDVYDMKRWENGGVKIRTRKLNHPQETYGYRLEYDGKVVVYTTDNEPFDPRFPDPRLLDLAKDADVWITDCQYTQEVYNNSSFSRHGWGHSYPEAVAETAAQAGVKTIVLFHHDPASGDHKIADIEQHTQELVGKKCKIVAAHEGLSIDID